MGAIRLLLKEFTTKKKKQLSTNTIRWPPLKHLEKKERKIQNGGHMTAIKSI